jgi:hypothetical protein
MTKQKREILTVIFNASYDGSIVVLDTNENRDAFDLGMEYELDSNEGFKSFNRFYQESKNLDCLAKDFDIILESYINLDEALDGAETMQELFQEWNNLNLIKMFEIDVLNLETQKKDWIVVDIDIELIDSEYYFTALSELGFVKVIIDFDFNSNIDYYLIDLYEAVSQLIIDSDSVGFPIDE